ncbi:MAG: enoyl-CoA hydratase/isomerase family protein [Pseudomonadota bacterium]
MKTDYQTIIVEQDRHVLSVLLNRPDARHAVNLLMSQELCAVLDEVADQSEIRVVVLGSTDAYFCSGTDLKEGFCGFKDCEEQLLHMYWPIIQKMHELPQTIIAAPAGTTAGIGCAFVLNSDLIVMHESASLFFTFSNIGLIADGGIHTLLQRHLGYQRTFELLTRGGHLSAQACSDAGIANRLVDAEDDFLKVAQSWAHELSNRAPLVLQHTKKLLRTTSLMSIEETVRNEAQRQNMCAVSEDASEGIMAFLEKRPAVFRGQ